MDAKALVCSACWNNFFNTESFRLLCEEVYRGPDAPYERVVRDVKSWEIHESARNGCNWCSCLLYCVHETVAEEGSHYNKDLFLEITLRNTYCEAATPVGKNIYYLETEFFLREGTGIGKRWQLELYAFTDPEDFAAPFVTARKLQCEVYSDLSRHQIQNWLAECANHNQCPEQTESILPTRVIEVNPSGSSGRPRLLLTAGRYGKYIALSYCWGSDLYGQLNRFNLGQYVQALDLDALPQTICDAITVTKNIGIPYLWVDSVCILQDSNHDKANEISVMDRVYKNSFLTLVAACSKSATAGFLHQRQPPKHEMSYIIPFHVSESKFGTMSIRRLVEVKYPEYKEPICHRAWTLQENMLSHRYLVYSSHTLQWRCQAGQRNLGDSFHLPEDEIKIVYPLYDLNKPGSNAKSELKRWKQLVVAYSRRSASLPSDKLNAISALAAGFSETLGPQYFAGVWQFSMLWQLTWSTYEDGGSIRPKVYRAPSWSWASIDGSINYPCYWRDNDTDDLDIYRCDFISCNTKLKSVHVPFGEVLGGSLKIKGVLRKAWLKPSTSDILWLAGDDEIPEEGLVSGAKGHYDEGGDWPPTLVFCLPIHTDNNGGFGGLLLVVSKEEENVFRRIGSFELYSKKTTHSFEHLPQREITII